MKLSFGHRSISPLTVIWLTAFAAAQAQITPFTTQPAAQTPQTQQQQQGQSTQGIAPVTPGAQTSIETIRPNYELGPSDQIQIHAPDAEELNDKTFRIEDDGNATLPLVGAVKMGGLTVGQVEDDLKNRLKTYIRNPLVSITVVQFRSAPVFFVGQFQRPGIYPLQGRHTLVEMMQSVGGLQPTAGRRIKITRKNESGPIPLSSAVEDPGTKTSSVEISLVSLTQNINPAEDIVLQPYDIITADRAESVYLMGAVGKAAPIQLGDRDSISVLQVMAESGTVGDDAQLSKAYILRPVLDTARRARIPLDISKVMSTEGNDYPLLANDILVIPKKKDRSALINRLETMGLGLVSSLLVFSLINGKL
ncbi:MAG TPA: polysaccharide biosynthesis/export family protein [Bryobacteraceae bacterium]